MSDKPIKWTFEEGVEEVKQLEKFLIPHGYHCALGGSVLHKGSSTCDLDIFIYPHKTSKTKSMLELLEAYYRATLIHANHEDSKSTTEDDIDGKKVFYIRPDGQRIDFFFVQ